MGTFTELLGRGSGEGPVELIELNQEAKVFNCIPSGEEMAILMAVEPARNRLTCAIASSWESSMMVFIPRS